MFSKLFIFTAVIIAITVAFLASGCGRHCSGYCHWGSSEKKAGWMAKKISKKLDFTPVQEEKLDKIKNEIISKKNEYREIRTGIFDEFLAQMNSEKVDQEKLNALLESKEEQIKQLRKFLVAKTADFHDILTPEQRAKLVGKLGKYKESNCGMGCSW